jgi:hypothetical protein
VNKSTVSEVIDRLAEFGFVKRMKRFSQSTIYAVSAGLVEGMQKPIGVTTTGDRVTILDTNCIFIKT